jgi:hypothetical protein
MKPKTIKFITSPKKLKSGESYHIHYADNSKKLACYGHSERGMNVFLALPNTIIITDQQIQDGEIKLEYIKTF